MKEEKAKTPGLTAEDIEWCPQHGYPLPCHKCGMPLSGISQREIYEKGVRAGREEIIKLLKDTENPSSGMDQLAYRFIEEYKIFISNLARKA